MCRRISELVRQRRQQPELRRHQSRAGVHQQKASCAVRVFHFARAKTRLTDQRRLLVSQNPRHRDTANRRKRGLAINFAAGAHLRQHRSRHLKRLQQLFVPIQCFYIEELCAARICHVCRVHASPGSAGEVPEKKRIDISEKQFARRGFLSRAGNIFEQPAQLQPAEIRAEWQAGFRTEAVLSACCGKAFHVIGNTGVLPNDGIGNRLSGLALPNHRSFALIRNADRR